MKMDKEYKAGHEADVATSAQIEGYLSRIREIGPETAKRVVDHFGSHTLDVLEENPQRLSEVENLPKTTSTITDAWRKQQEIERIAARFREWGLKPELAARVFRRYGGDALEIIEKSPHRMALEIRGIDFKNADRVSRQLGVGATASKRLTAGVQYILTNAAAKGHICLPYERLTDLSAAVLNLSPKLLQPIVEGLALDGKVVIERLPPEKHRPHGDRIAKDEIGFVYLSDLYQRLNSFIQGLKRLVKSDPVIRFEDIDPPMNNLSRKWGLSLTPDQKEAVKRSVSNKITLIIGGKGVGKTTTALFLANLFAHEGLRTLIVSPTHHENDFDYRLGNADLGLRIKNNLGNNPQSTIINPKSNDLHEGISSRTITDLLNYDVSTGRYGVSGEERLSADLLILDEAIEVDMAALDALLNNLSITASAVLVGDVGCDSPPGGGGFWGSLAASGIVDTVELENLPKDEKTSLLALNALRLSQGQYLYFKSQACKKDFQFLKRTGGEEIKKTAQDLIKNHLPNDYGYDSSSEVQVITSALVGALGEINLNRSLQMTLNPDGKRVGRSDLRVGDRVIQEADNLQRKVLEGEVGRIEESDNRSGNIRVSFGGYLVDFPPEEIEELALAYALSPQRTYRGRVRAVIVLLDSESKSSLDRMGLYRALAKADEMVFLVGGKKTLSRAIKKEAKSAAYSSLLHKFVEEDSPSRAGSNGHDAYLDVEAARNGQIVLIGIHVPERGTLQLVGRDITPKALFKSLNGVKTIYTYNGDRYDLPAIKKEFGVDLKARYATHDLIYDCHKRNLFGGLKKVEEVLGIGRKTEGLRGNDAVKLWGRYQSLDDEESYKLLLLYNKEDVENLHLLRERLGVKRKK